MRLHFLPERAVLVQQGLEFLGKSGGRGNVSVGCCHKRFLRDFVIE